MRRNPKLHRKTDDKNVVRLGRQGVITTKRFLLPPHPLRGRGEAKKVATTIFVTNAGDFFSNPLPSDIELSDL